MLGSRLRRKGNWTRLAVFRILTACRALNAGAGMPAWSMTHDVAAGSRTAKPEHLSLAEKGGTIRTGVTIPRPTNTHTPADRGRAYTVQQIPVGGGEQLAAWAVPQSATGRGCGARHREDGPGGG